MILNAKLFFSHIIYNNLGHLKSVKLSDDKVWKILRKNDIQLQRHRSWCISTDPEFSEKAADIVGLYINPPPSTIIMSFLASEILLIQEIILSSRFTNINRKYTLKKYKYILNKK